MLLPVAELSAQLYRWVDDQGTVHYTDRIPPEYTEKGHDVLSSSGTATHSVPPAKTPEEIRRERELERLRAEQHRLIEKQKAADRVLLRTFRSVDDLIMVRDGKLAAIDVMIRVTKNNIRSQQNYLKDLRAKAAELERAGEPISERIERGIAKSERALQNAFAVVLERERQKQDIRESFARDLTRLRQLKEIDDTPLEADAKVPAELPNVVTCRDAGECERLWHFARDYLQRHATLPTETSSRDVVMTAAPDGDQEIGLTVSRIWNKDQRGASILLDVQCAGHVVNEESCRTPEREQILDGFRAAVETAAAQAAAPAAGLPRTSSN